MTHFTLNRYRQALGLLLLTLGMSCPLPGQSLPWPAVRDSIHHLMQEAGIPGLMLTVIRDDSVWFAGGMGEAESGRPVTDTTRFRLGSISKTFASLAVVHLVQEGKLSLEQEVASLLPDIAIRNRWATERPVRVVHLLEHTSGFDDLHPAAFYIRDGQPKTAREMAKGAQNSLFCRWAPGTRMAYSNANYVLLGYVIEQVSGIPYDAYIDEVVFQPLGMQQANFLTFPPAGPGYATGHYQDARGAVVPVAFRPTNASAAGALQASARDMAAFLTMLLRCGRDTGATYWLPPAMLQRMETPTTTYAAQAGLRHGYGLGIYHLAPKQGGQWRGHNGGIDGFVSQYAYSRRLGRAFAVSANATLPIEPITTLLLAWLSPDSSISLPPPYPLDETALAPQMGFFTFTAPRSQLQSFQHVFSSARELRVQGDTLHSGGWFSPEHTWVAVNDSLHFRRTDHQEASLVLFRGPEEGKPGFALGGSVYRQGSKGQHLAFLVLFLGSIIGTTLFIPVGLVWLGLGAAKRVKRAGVLPVWPALLSSLGLLSLFTFLNRAFADFFQAGLLTPDTLGVFLSGLALGLGALISFLMAVRYVSQRGLDLWPGYLLLNSIMQLFLAVYFFQQNLIGLRLWAY